MMYDPRKPKPWPIRLAFKVGAKDDAQAQLIVLVVAVILIGVTIYLYSDLLSNDAAEPLDPAVLREMELQMNR